jgi:hypothetical protein
VYKIVLILLAFTNLLFSQTGSITGRVTDGSKPIPGVNIFIVGTTTGGSTDIDGFYRISNVPVGDQTLQFSAINFITIREKVEIIENRTLELNVDLEFKTIRIDEVKVLDDKIQEQQDTRTSLINLKPKSARVMPGAVTDVFRTLQSLPGVLAPNDFSSQLIVRGSGPDQNLIIMDNVEIFNPYRLYGVISMFNPEAVSDINLITGGFPARYGDRLSAVLDVTNRQGSRSSNLTGNLNASIVAANLVLEGKNPFDLPGSWIVNSRRTYYDLIIEPFVKNSGLVEDNVSFPNFYDIQTKLAFGPFDGHKFFINGIYSRDGVELVSGENRTTADSIGVVDLSKNDLFSAAWHFAPNDNMLNKLTFSWYRNSGDANFDSELLDPSLDENDFEDVAPDTLQPYLVNFGFDTDFAFRKYSIDNRFTLFWGEGNEFEAGIGYDIMRTTINFSFDIDPQLKSFLSLNPNIRAVFTDLSDDIDYNRLRAHLQNRFKFGNLFLQPGLRIDNYEIHGKTYFAPRFSASYALDDVTTLRGVWGVYYQSLGYEKLRDRQRIFDFTRAVTTSIDAEKSTHYVLSIERWLTNEWKVKLETYLKDFDDLIEPVTVPGTGYITSPIPGEDLRLQSGWTAPVSTVVDSFTTIPANNSFGEAYGFEVLVEKKNIYGSNEINGWLSYSLAYANRYIDGQKIPFRFDQRHTVNLVLNYDINDWLNIGTRFQFGSGFPITEAVGVKPRIIFEDQNGDFIPETPVVATRGNTNNVIYDVDFGDKTNRFAGRKPDYHRLDVRLNAQADYWDLDWTFYLDIVNIYNRANVVNYDYAVDENQQLTREATNMFPILPTLGFNVRF